MGKRILIVDDDISFVAAARRALKAAGYDPVLASSVADAEAVVEHGAPDLILLSPSTSDGEGLTLCHLVRQCNEGRGVPVLFTGKGEGPVFDQETALARGGLGYYEKPVDWGRVVADISELLAAASVAPASSSTPAGSSSSRAAAAVGRGGGLEAEDLFGDIGDLDLANADIEDARQALEDQDDSSYDSYSAHGNELVDDIQTEPTSDVGGGAVGDTPEWKQGEDGLGPDVERRVEGRETGPSLAGPEEDPPWAESARPPSTNPPLPDSSCDASQHERHQDTDVMEPMVSGSGEEHEPAREPGPSPVWGTGHLQADWRAVRPTEKTKSRLGTGWKEITQDKVELVRLDEDELTLRSSRLPEVPEPIASSAPAPHDPPRATSDRSGSEEAGDGSGYYTATSPAAHPVTEPVDGGYDGHVASAPPPSPEQPEGFAAYQAFDGLEPEAPDLGLMPPSSQPTGPASTSRAAAEVAMAEERLAAPSPAPPGHLGEANDDLMFAAAEGEGFEESGFGDLLDDTEPEEEPVPSISASLLDAGDEEYDPLSMSAPVKNASSFEASSSLEKDPSQDQTQYAQGRVQPVQGPDQQAQNATKQAQGQAQYTHVPDLEVHDPVLPIGGRATPPLPQPARSPDDGQRATSQVASTPPGVDPASTLAERQKLAERMKSSARVQEKSPLQLATKPQPGSAPFALEGSLVEVDVPHLLAECWRARSTGLLRITGPTGIRRVYLELGRPVAALSDVVDEQLPEVALRLGRVLKEQADEVRRRGPLSPRQQAVHLVELGALKAQELYDTVRAQAQAALFGAFTVEEGSWRWLEEACSEDLRVALPDHPFSLITDGIRRKLSLVRIHRRLGGPATLLVTSHAPELHLLGLTARERRLAEQVDGLKTAEELVFISGLGEEATYQVLYALAATGQAAVKVRGPMPEGRAFTPEERQAEVVIDRRRIEEKFRQALESDYFEILGVPPEATAYEIRTAHERLSRIFHPGRYAAEEFRDLWGKIEEIRRALDDAHDVLKDEGLRVDYVEALLARKGF